MNIHGVFFGDTKRLATFGVALVLLSPGLHAQTAALNLFTSADSPPLESQADGKLTGVSIDLLKTAFGLAGVSYTFSVQPWKRSLQTAMSQDGTCVFTAVRTVEREKLFKWIGPLVSDALVVYALESNKTVINSIDDLKKFTVGATVGEAITDVLTSGGVKVDAISGEDDDQRNLKRLKLGRIDFWAISSLRGQHTAGTQPDVKIRPALVIKKMDDYMGCNPGVSDKVIEKINVALEKMSKDGTTKAILNTYHLAAPKP